jgi:flagellar hook-associated protein 1 FlgK
VAIGFSSLEVARSGLFVNERGLFVTGQNISNVDTPGYTRQQAIIATANYKDNVTYQLGLGADIQKIRQVRHSFLDNVYRGESQPLGYWEARQKTFQDIQAIFGEPMEEGMQYVMNQFWDSWQELSKDPGNLTTRAIVRQRGSSLVQYLDQIGQQLDRTQKDLDSEIKDKIEEINIITENIARLNVKISESEISGDTANDMRDQRNLYIDKLSKLIGCQTFETQDGQVDITVGGYFIVNKSNSEKIVTVPNEKGSMFSSPAIKDGDITLPITGGTLKGLIESRGEVKYSKGSTENGSTNDKVDLVFAINTSDNILQRTNLVNNIEAIVKAYKDKGMQVRLGYEVFDSTGIKSSSFGGKFFTEDIDQFRNAVGTDVPSASAQNGEAAALGAAMNAVISADDTDNWNNTARQFVLISDTKINTAGMKELSGRLQAENINTLVISDGSNAIYSKELSSLAETTGDRYLVSGALTPDTDDDIKLMDEVIESVRNNVYGDVSTTGNIIPDLRKRINLLVSALAREVNRLHRSGMTLGATSHQGSDFFVPVDSNYPMEMGNIQINPKLRDLNEIVASYDSTSGDNTVALQISDLRHMMMLGNSGEIQSIDGFYHSTLMWIGDDGAEAQRVAEGQGSLVNSLDNQRLSISNVSMDEEMTNMMKYQFAYGASARVITVLDEMFESIVNRLGLVGR